MSVDPRAVLDRPAPPLHATRAYGEHTDQIIKLRWPAGRTDHPYPLVAVIHGGFWRARITTGPTPAE